MLDLGPEPGWTGQFSRGQAPGCYPNDSRVEKCAKDPDDARPIGATGTVLGSIRLDGLGSAYFVEWDDMPRCAVFVIGWKLKELAR